MAAYERREAVAESGVDIGAGAVIASRGNRYDFVGSCLGGMVVVVGGAEEGAVGRESQIGARVLQRGLLSPECCDCLSQFQQQVVRPLKADRASFHASQ